MRISNVVDHEIMSNVSAPNQKGLHQHNNGDFIKRKYNIKTGDLLIVV